MRIQDLLNEDIPYNQLPTAGAGTTFKAAMGMNTNKSMLGNLGAMAKVGAAKALGLNNVAGELEKRAGVGSAAVNPIGQGSSNVNPQQLIKQLGIKQGTDFQIDPKTKVKITKIDQVGAHYTDPKNGLPTILGADGLTRMLQQQQAIQTLQQQQAANQTTQPAVK
jgi:hypothetical protein